MKMRLVAAAGAAALLFSMIPATSANAADGGGGSSVVTATLGAGAIGSRSVTLVAPIVMSSLLNSATVSGNYSVLVTEAARTGTDPWSVTGALSDLTDTGNDTLAATNFAISGRSVVKVSGGGTASSLGTTEDMSAARTLWTDSGQSTASVYTGTYTGTGTLTLTPPNGQATGTYTGTFTVTLVQ